MVYAVLVGCEIGFWVVIAAGLICRYRLRRPRLGAMLLALTPVVDLVLLTAAVVDIRQGAEADARHALAAIYLGVSAAFGPRMVAWADARFARRLSEAATVATPATSDGDRARRERGGWYRHAAAWVIAAATLGVMHLAGGNREETRGLFGVLGPWLVILGIDFVWSFSYTVFPGRSGRDRSLSR